MKLSEWLNLTNFLGQQTLTVRSIDEIESEHSNNLNNIRKTLAFYIMYVIKSKKTVCWLKLVMAIRIIKVTSLNLEHYSDVIMSMMASQITSLSIVYSTLCSGPKKTSKLHVTGLCEVNSPVTGEFPAQRASNVENVSIWWCHHE